MAGRNLSLGSFIYQVKQELLEAQREHEGELGMFEMQSAEIEATVTANLGADGGVNLSVVRVGSKKSTQTTHTVRLSFDVLDSGRKSSRSTSRRKSGKKTKKRKVKRGGRVYKKRRK